MTMNSKNKIKCVIWDLDNTLWDGTLLEDSKVTLRDGIVNIIQALDARGILQSIASKNDSDIATKKLEEFGLLEYFIYNQINWNPKSESVKRIAQSINIGLDTIAFIDDQIFERDEVKFKFPEVLCIDALETNSLLAMPEMNPRFITDDSKDRRQMYLNDIARNKAEETFAGTQQEFLSTLKMKLTIAPLTEDDLKRAEELTVRTHQLNTTGYTYSYEELDAFRKSPNHKLLIMSLKDKYGSYGKIGLVLIECEDNRWNIKLLLMSCRVISRGVGTIVINYISNIAKAANVRLFAEFVSNDRNRMMYVTYKFSGFKEVENKDSFILLENEYDAIQPYPDYVELDIT